MYDFDKAFDRSNTECIKWDFQTRQGELTGLLPFGIADMDFEVLPQLTQALVQRAQHPTYGYTYPSQEYYDSFIDWNRERNGFYLSKEEILSVPGVVCAISFVIHALTAPGDQVLVNTPVYNPFFDVVKQHGRRLVTSSLLWKDGRHQLDFADMEQKLSQGVKLLILCNPHNPVGRVWTREELEQVVELCAKYNAYLFSDEIHSDLIFPGHTHLPLLKLSPKAEEIGLMAMAPSKTFNIAGLKSSMLIIKNPQLRDKVRQAMQAFHVGVGLFGLKATQVVYRHGAQWADELVAYLYSNAQFVVDFVEKNLPKAKAYLPESTYLMWLDFSGFGLGQEELMDKLTREAKVSFIDGTRYGEEGLGFVRVNIGTQRAMLQKALEQVAQVF